MQPSSHQNPLTRDVVLPASGNAPLDLHRRLPGYAPTPLRIAPSLAETLGVSHVLVKDEAARLGLPAFKMLGASWACYRSLSERLGTDPDVPAPWTTLAELAERFRPLQPLTFATATDGNHGRAVARFARLLGFACRIWVPATTSRARVDAIKGEGASVAIVTGGYDDAVRISAEAADERTLVVSDTSWPGYEDVPEWVIEGYSTVFQEIDQQLVELGAPRPQVVFVPIGVGAFAAAVARHYRRPNAPAPTLIGVEPVDAACVLESVKAGRPLTLTKPQDSIMAGLNCGTPSLIAWPLVSRAFDWFVAVDDEQAREAMRRLADAGIVSGESGAASLAGATQLRHDTAELVLRSDSTVLLLSTEGASDPLAYERVVGLVPSAVTGAVRAEGPA